VQAIERPLIRIRPLGASDIIEIENAVTLFATGNQMRVRGDMVRRTLISDLDANRERPELRAFTANPVAMVLANRGHYVSACLMIVRAYIVAGKPERLTPIASFGDWSDLVRSALVWLGCDDPALSMEAARADDPELAQLRELLEYGRRRWALPRGSQRPRSRSGPRNVCPAKWRHHLTLPTRTCAKRCTAISGNAASSTPAGWGIGWYPERQNRRGPQVRPAGTAHGG